MKIKLIFNKLHPFWLLPQQTVNIFSQWKCLVLAKTPNFDTQNYFPIWQFHNCWHLLHVSLETVTGWDCHMFSTWGLSSDSAELVIRSAHRAFWKPSQDQVHPNAGDPFIPQCPKEQECHAYQQVTHQSVDDRLKQLNGGGKINFEGCGPPHHGG